MVPNIPENPRGRKVPKRGGKQCFDPAIFEERFGTIVAVCRRRSTARVTALMKISPVVGSSNAVASRTPLYPRPSSSSSFGSSSCLGEITHDLLGRFMRSPRAVDQGRSHEGILINKLFTPVTLNRRRRTALPSIATIGPANPPVDDTAGSLIVF